MIGAEARIDNAQPEEAVDQQAGAGQQDQREAHLGNHQGRLRPVRPPARGVSAGASLDCFVHIHAGGAPGGEQPEEYAGGGCDGEREDHDSHVDADVCRARHFGRQQGLQQVHGPQRQQQSAGAARQGQYQAFRQHLAKQARVAGAQGAPHRQLAGPRRHTHQQKIGYIYANDQQQETNCAEQHQQRRPYLADDMRVERNNRNVLTHERTGLLEVQPVHDRAQFALSPGDTSARPQPADHPEVVRGAAGRGLAQSSHRQPDFGLGRITEAARHHADDGHGITTDSQGAADDFRVAAVSALP